MKSTSARYAAAIVPSPWTVFDLQPNMSLPNLKDCDTDGTLLDRRSELSRGLPRRALILVCLSPAFSCTAWPKMPSVFCARTSQRVLPGEISSSDRLADFFDRFVPCATPPPVTVHLSPGVGVAARWQLPDSSSAICRLPFPMPGLPVCNFRVVHRKCCSSASCGLPLCNTAAKF